MQRFLILIVGIIFIAVGGFLYWKNDYLAKNCTEEALATVVDMKQELSTDSDSAGYLYYPIIEYQVSGDTIRVVMEAGSNTPAYDIDQKITILYNPKKVKELIVKGEKSSEIISIVICSLGVLLAGYGLYVAIKKN